MRRHERIDTLVKRLQKEFYREHEEELQGEVVLEVVEEQDSEGNDIVDFNLHILDSQGESYAEDTYATFNEDDIKNQEKVYYDLTVKRNIGLLPW